MSRQQNTYRGIGETRVVEVTRPDGSIYRLDPRLDLRQGAFQGFDWGEDGRTTDTVQLAIALCADVLQDDNRAMRIYSHFKGKFLALLNQGEDWEAPASVLDQLMKEAERDFGP